MHSHDPVCGWALRSKADYAFASLRKTLPVPDGAILWSPRSLPLPASGSSQSSASALKLGAMIWKREYLKGGSTLDAKSIYRAWQQEGETDFDKCKLSFATALSQQYVSCGVPVEWRRRRAANARRLLSKLQDHTECHPVFSDWPQEAAPLGTVFEFESQARRDATRHKLQQHGVYCPIHWPGAAGCDPAAQDLAGRLLTIPSDQRYGSRHMDKIASLLNNR
jgi:hypothetical protein